MGRKQLHRCIVAATAKARMKILGMLVSCALLICISNAQGQSITSDGSLGTMVTLDNSNYTISEGTIRGTNQFHSFGKFNVFQGESAIFTGPVAINNIIGRVTGGSESLIDGLLKSEINGANLYLLNPNGVLFGPNASLNVNGSFHVSTADFIRLGENGVFYASLSENSVLTIDPPTAFGFLSENPSGISIRQSNLEVPDGETLSVIGGNIEIEGGRVIAPGGRINIASVASPGKVTPNRPGEAADLKMVSFGNFGAIELSDSLVNAGGVGGGTVFIRGGRFHLSNANVFASASGTGNGDPGVGVDAALANDVIFDGSRMGANVFSGVITDSGGVKLTADNVALKNFSEIQSVANTGSIGRSGDIVVTARKDLTLDHGSMIRTGTGGAGNSGDILVRARNIAVRDASIFYSPVFDGSGNGGNIEVLAEGIELSNNFPGSLTGINTNTDSPGTGKAGDINIQTGSLNITAGTEISSATFFTGQGGNISLTAEENISIQGNKDLLPFQTGIFANTLNGSGQGGSLQLTTNRLDMTTNTAIQVSTFFGTGHAGNARIEAETMQLMDASFITTAGLFGNGGNAGNLEVNAESIYISGPESSPDPFGSGFTGMSTMAGPIGGTGGHLNITATDNLTLTNRSQIGTGSSGPGPGGNVEIISGHLEVINGANIQSIAKGSGDAGNIQILANQVRVSGVHPDPSVNEITGKSNLSPSAITTQTLDKEGKAGDVIITANIIEVMDGAMIDARTFGPAVGGNIRFNAESVYIAGENTGMREFLASRGGSPLTARSRVQTNAESLLLGDDATGNAGNIFIEAKELNLLNKGLINSETTGPGMGGNITMVTDRTTISGDARILAVSAVSPNAGEAGNISISVRDTFDNDNGIVSSAAGAGAGGDVSIEANRIYLRNEAFVSARNVETGTAGSVRLYAGSRIHSDHSTITVTAEQGEGGNINISAPEVLLTNGAVVSAETSGNGNAGKINVTARDLFWMDKSMVNTEAKQADGGNIKINSAYMVNLWDSVITSSVGGGPDTLGGNINIDPKYVTLSNSKIAANAFEGKGGNIRIVTDVFMSDLDSVVEASSEKGIDGVVEIDALQKVVAQSVKPLPENFRSAVALLREPCIARLTAGKYSSFVISGRDAMPIQPGGLLPSPISP